MSQRRRDLAACEASIKAGSQSFYAASRLLPHRVRLPSYSLYAFCRAADDLVDNGDATAGLAALRQRLDNVYDQKPADFSEDRAMSGVARRYGIPRAIFDSMLEGFEWDTTKSRYADIDELEDYSVRVASTVGVMMCLLMEVRNTETLERACDLGIAMQLTNVARDVGEDARAGRLYLPTQWMDQAGIDVDRWLDKPAYTSPVGWVVQQLLRRADQRYSQALSGVRDLPGDCQAAIGAAGLIYAEIGRVIVANNWDSVSQRAVVSKHRKRMLLAKASTTRRLGTTTCTLSTPQSAMDLIRSVTDCSTHATTELGSRGELGRVDWTLRLFEQLAKRKNGQASGAPEAF